MAGALVLAAMFAALLAGIDVAFALAGLGVVLLLLADFSPLMIPQALMSSMDNFILLSVPLFILMSNILLRGGAGEDLFGAVQSWVGHWPGGLAVATVLSCAIFASISGSSVATSATIGTVAIPAMVTRGYQRRFTYGLLAAGGTLGILIPPSIPMIIYGFVTGESIIELFLAGIGPGVLLTLMFIAYAVVRARLKRDYVATARADARQRIAASRRALPALALAVLIVAGIYFGAFTPTEAAAIGFAGALVITMVVNRTLRPADLAPIALDSMRTSVMVLFIIAGAKVFGQAITLYQIPQDVTAAVVGGLATPGAFIVVICALLLAMGCVLETLSMMLLMLPVIQPSLIGLNIDAIWFGVIFTMMIECALITPPVGLNLFVIRAVAAQGGRVVTVADVVYGTLPFVVLILIAVAITTALPDLALFIPRSL
ncbi:MAG TPA: TRAP transporter large permease [Alphaproteobacteria bacterium]